MSESYQNITLERLADPAGVALLTLNRPQVRNALDLTTWLELGQAVAAVEADPQVQLLVITGAGEKAFAAGADLAWLRDRTPYDALTSRVQGVLLHLEQMLKPSIAAVNGLALGGGCELALACDIRIASDRAVFGQPEVSVAIMPGAGGTQRLPRLVGKAKAKEMILTGDTVAADEALRIGLVGRVVPPAQLLPEAFAMARKILSKGPWAVRLAKSAINVGMATDLHAGLAYERLALAVLFGTADKHEAITAFLAKRSPRFEGR